MVSMLRTSVLLFSLYPWCQCYVPRCYYSHCIHGVNVTYLGVTILIVSMVSMLRTSVLLFSLYPWLQFNQYDVYSLNHDRQISHLVYYHC